MILKEVQLVPAYSCDSWSHDCVMSLTNGVHVTSCSHSEVHSLQSPVSDIMEGYSRASRPLLNQQHSPSLLDLEDRLLTNGRSISLIDLQDTQNLLGSTGPQTHHEAPTYLSRTGSQASIGLSSPRINSPHSNPVTPQPVPHPARAGSRDGQPQSAPQVRRPLQCSLLPLSFQNPVYHLNNPAHFLSTHSSSDNLSTESSHASHSNSDDFGSQVGSKGGVLPGQDELGSRQSVQTKDCSIPRCHPVPDLPLGAATAIAIPRQSTTAGTAHIIRVEQQSRGGGGARTPHSILQSASLHSGSSINTEPMPTTSHTHHQQSTCSVENVTPPPRSAVKQVQQVWQEHDLISKAGDTAVMMSLLCAQVGSPVEAVAMSPVERTAAWVLNNSQYDEEEEGGERSRAEQGRNPEKVCHAHLNTHTWTGCLRPLSHST